MEVLPQQPFYVYGHGWASCNPDASMQAYELHCKKLQVGDVCMSCYTVESLLSHTNSHLSSAPSAIAPPHAITSILHHDHNDYGTESQVHKTSNQQQSSPQSPYYPHYSREEIIPQMPQNLSRRSNSTILTTATGTTVTSRPITTHFDTMYDKMSTSLGGITVHSPKTLSQPMHSPYAGTVSNHIDTLGSDGGSRTNSSSSSSSYSGGGGGGCVSGGSLSSVGSASSTNSNGDINGQRSSSNQCTSAISLVVQRFINDESFDQINSKKRRWSAPDNICDDDQTGVIDEKKLSMN